MSTVHRLLRFYFSALLIFGCVLLNYFLPEKALSYLIYIVVSAAVLNWILISLIHLKFRQAMKQQGIQTKIPSIICTVYQLFGFGFHADDFIHHVDARL